MEEDITEDRKVGDFEDDESRNLLRSTMPEESHMPHHWCYTRCLVPLKSTRCMRLYVPTALLPFEVDSTEETYPVVYEIQPSTAPELTTSPPAVSTAAQASTSTDCQHNYTDPFSSSDSEEDSNLNDVLDTHFKPIPVDVLRNAIRALPPPRVHSPMPVSVPVT